MTQVPRPADLHQGSAKAALVGSQMIRGREKPGYLPSTASSNIPAKGCVSSEAQDLTGSPTTFPASAESLETQSPVTPSPPIVFPA